jgi:hypothetical protein
VSFVRAAMSRMRMRGSAAMHSHTSAWFVKKENGATSGGTTPTRP